jgi:hypothetical protein
MKKGTAMAGRFRYAGFLLATLIFTGGAPAWGQEDAAPARNTTAQLPNVLRARMADLPPQWIEQLQQMSPSEQQRFLSNNERFRSLSPQAKAQIWRRLRAWNGLPLEQRQALLERRQIWEQLPADQQRQVRETLLPMWRSLPPARRRIVLGKLRELRTLDGAQREGKFQDESFLEGLSLDERDMLEQLSSLGVPEADG